MALVRRIVQCWHGGIVDDGERNTRTVPQHNRLRRNILGVLSQYDKMSIVLRNTADGDATRHGGDGLWKLVVGIGWLFGYHFEGIAACSIDVSQLVFLCIVIDGTV